MNDAPARQQTFRYPARKIVLAGESAWCDHRGVLWLPSIGALVVSDLHFEKGSSFARRGIMLPPYDTAATLRKLETAILDYAPAIVICLGDSFHDNGGPARLDAGHRSQLISMTENREWFWISGNHDEQAPEGLPGYPVRELAAGGLTFRHVPDSRASSEIAGHLHPGARIVRRGRSVRRPCFIANANRMILPAFGVFTGMLNVLDRAYDGLFGEDRPTAYMLGRNAVFPISADILQPG